jgi:regulator of cell morphogenesis and NO signaling
MHTTDRNAAVGQLVAERPGRARVFERWGIDYCCGGRKPLEAACQEKALDAEAVLRDLSEADSAGTACGETDWSRASLSELADHIVTTHHAYLRQELPRLTSLLAKVAHAHGNRHPELRSVRRVFETLTAELQTHMVKEENGLFPMFRLQEAARTRTHFPFGATIRSAIRILDREHEDTGRMLAKIRMFTGGFAPPPGACSAYRALLDGLAQLEADLHLHIHEENNILFPRAIALEETLFPAQNTVRS